jgi:uncharacterized protein YukE
MADTIYYDYGANLGTLDTLKAAINDAEHLRQDVHQVFNALVDVYHGQAADALQQTQTSVSQQMDQVIMDIRGLLQQAVERQYITQAQDQQLAGGF